MNKTERLTKNINNDKAIMKRLRRFYNLERLIDDAQAYLKALKEGRLRVTVETVSRSGMSRTLGVTSCEKGGKGYYQKFYYRNYTGMLEALGNSLNREGNVRIGGCGMNMLFAFNYGLCRQLKKLGFISRKQCVILEQKVN